MNKWNVVSRGICDGQNHGDGENLAGDDIAYDKEYIGGRKGEEKEGLGRGVENGGPAWAETTIGLSGSNVLQALGIRVESGKEEVVQFA